MVKSKQHNFLVAVGAVCLTFVLAIAFLNVMSKDDFSETNFSEVDFPLEIDLPTTVFNVGDKISVMPQNS
ncbi:MAG: hypothetical protein LBC03_03315 [Nitrososphaerota archaeon]|jgi:hypothetical protein|nr:hypothetical protein [Nitrososphaerota archaeon]